MSIRAFVLLALACLHAGPVLAAGFNCAKASSRVERTICGDANLSTLDEHLERYFHAARDALGEGAACLRDDQRHWLKVRDACDAKACLERAYLDRLAELDGLQPGATTIKHRELARRPALAWIVPPAADKVAAPPNPKAAPARVTGTLVDDIASGDGIVLRTPAGERYVLVLLMFLDGPTAERLPALARDRGATFTARGHLAPNGAGIRAFEPSRCLYLYRQP